MFQPLLHWRVIVAMIFLAAVAVLCAVGRLHWAFAGVYGVMSLASVAMYGWDKRQAIRNRWRTRERTLLAIDLFSGWPGGLIAQRLWRHKNQKAPYQLLYWLMVSVNTGLLAVWVYWHA